MSKNDLGPNDSVTARGARLRQIRLMSDIGTEELAREIGFSRASVSYWENARYSGLSRKGAEKILRIINARGVECELPWLLYGIGSPPRYIPQDNDLNKKAADAREISEKKPVDIHDEIHLFQSNYSDSVIFHIQHNALLPFYCRNDYVGGIWENFKSNMIGSIVIIKTEDIIDVRLIKQKKPHNKFNISFLNPLDINIKNNFFENDNMEILKFARIRRLWRL